MTWDTHGYSGLIVKSNRVGGGGGGLRLGFGPVNFCRIRHWVFLYFLDLDMAMAFGI